MTSFADDLIAERFAAVANQVDDSNWADVLRRADEAARPVGARRRGRSRQALVALAVVVVAVLGFLLAAPAFGLRVIPIFDFFSAKHAPRRVVMDFGRLQVSSPPGMAPGVLAHQARRVTQARLASGRTSVLYVAPTKLGGFCYEWTGAAGGCLKAPLTRSSQPHLSPAQIVIYNRLPIAITEARGGGVANVIGVVRSNDRATVRIEYADGTNADVPYVWVSKPINAGFFLFAVPKNHQHGAGRAVAIALFDGTKRIARKVFPTANRPPGTVHKLGNGQLIEVPRDAIYADRETVSLRTSNGRMINAWVAPRRGGGSCYWFTRGGGCLPASLIRKNPFLIDIYPGTNPVLLAGPVAPQVTRVELRFQDGSTRQLRPSHGFLLTEITPTHYPLGHRLVTATGYDSHGHILGQYRAQPARRGIYPCKTPKSLGYGVKQCP